MSACVVAPLMWLSAPQLYSEQAPAEIGDTVAPACAVVVLTLAAWFAVAGLGLVFAVGIVAIEVVVFGNAERACERVELPKFLGKLELERPAAASSVSGRDSLIAVEKCPSNIRSAAGQLEREFYRPPVSGAAAPPAVVSISGVASFGTLSGSPTGRDNKLYEVVDNLFRELALARDPEDHVSFNLGKMLVGFRRREKGKLLRRRGNMRLLSRWLRLRRDKKASL